MADDIDARRLVRIRDSSRNAWQPAGAQRPGEPLIVLRHVANRRLRSSMPASAVWRRNRLDPDEDLACPSKAALQPRWTRPQRSRHPK